MAFTNPMLTLPIVLTGAAAQLRLLYADATAVNITVDAGTYYFDDSDTSVAGSYDLCRKISEEMTAAVSGVGGETWTVANVATGLKGRLTFSFTGSSKTPYSIQSVDAELSSVMLGIHPTNETFAIGFSGTSSATTTYQRAGIWLPRDIELAPGGDTDDRHVCVLAHTPSGAGVVDHYGGYTLRHLMIGPAIPGAIIKTEYAADSGHVAQVSGLTISDPNVSLQAFLARLRLVADGASIPTLRYAVDDTAPATYKEIRLLDPELYNSTVAWTGGTATSQAPLLYGVNFEAADVS